MADDRNFRSNYYKKFGFRNIEEKKSIELLLKEHPLDVEKLRLFCLRFPVSARYRLYLWKLVLGVIPANQDSHEFVTIQRKEQYGNLRHALDVMRRVNEKTSLPVVFLKMFLIEEGRLPFDETEMVTQPENRSFVNIANAVSSMTEDTVDAYWVTTKFYRVYRKHADVLHALPAKTIAFFKKEDPDQKLWLHMEKHDVWSALPLSDWFSSCFAGVLPDQSFERIGDIVLGGSLTVLVYVTVAILLTLRRPLLIMNSRDEMLKYLQQIPEDSGEILVNKAIDMWENHGHHLTKSDSPGPVNRSPT